MAKFSPEGYNDPIWAVAFFAHIGLVCTWVGYCASAGHYRVKESSHAVVALYHGDASVAAALGSDASGAAVASTLAFGSILFAAVWSAVWLLLLQMVPEQIVRASLVVGPCTFVVMALVSVVRQQLLAAAISLGLAALLAAYAYFVWDRVALTAKLFKAVSKTYQTAGGVFLVGLGAIVLQAAWMVLSALSFLPVKQSGHGIGMYFLLFVSFYWGFQVVANVLYVTCGGVCARYYFNEKTEGAVCGSLRQAATNYLGSICFGSLVIAIIQAARATCHMMKEQASDDGNIAAVIMLMVADCFLGCLESLAQFFNTYVFAYIAVFGMNFSEASGKVWELVSDSDAECLLNYSLVGSVTFFAGVAAGTFNAAFTSLCAWRLGAGGAGLAGAAVLGFFVGVAVMAVVSYIIESGCTTLFVCYAESKDLLTAFDEDLSQAFSENMDVAKEKKKLK